MEVRWAKKEACEEKAKEPCSRKGHMAVRVPGQIVVFGGEDVIKNISEQVQYITVSMFSMRVIWVYHLEIDRWTKTALPETHVVPPPSAFACAVAIGSQIYLHGGFLVRSDTAESTGALWKLTSAAAGITWSEMKFRNKKSIPSPRFLHVGWEYEEKLWIFGGVGVRLENYMFIKDDSKEGDDSDDDDDNNNDSDDDGKFSWNNQLACYNPNNNKWNTVLFWGTAPSPRSSHAVAKIKDNIWLYGGQTINGIHDDLYKLNMESLTWTLIESSSGLIYSARTGHTFTAVSDHEIALYGGSRFTNDTSLWILDIQTLSWKECDTLFSDCTDGYGRERHTATMGADSLIIFGGWSYSSWNVSEHEPSCNINMLQWTLAPKSLVKSAMETVYKNRSVSQQEWKTLPRHLYRQLCAMRKIDAADDKDVGDEAEDWDMSTEDVYNDDAANQIVIWDLMIETFMTYTKNEMIAL